MLCSTPRIVRGAGSSPRALSSPRVAGARRGEMQKASVASTVVRELEEQLTYAPAYVSIDAAALNKKLEAKSKALIALEEQEATTWPKVRVRLQQQIGLGEVWKLVGRVPELGRFSPIVAPAFTWNEGHVWTYEGRVRPGTWLFKVVLRRADNAYIWEEGQDRVIDIPDTAGPDDTFEFVVDDVKLESRRW